MALLTIVATVLAGFTAWQLWTFTKARIWYDMHKVPGPRAWPVLGNLGEVTGTSSFHKVYVQWLTQGSFASILGPQATMQQFAIAHDVRALNFIRHTPGEAVHGLLWTS